MRAVLQWLLRSFLKGLLLVVPLAVTAWVFVVVFRWIDGLLGIPVPGAGFAVTLVIIVAVGALGSLFLVNRLVAYLEEWVGRVPFAKLIYFPLKDFIGAFVGEKKSFRQPVLVSLGPGTEAKVLGFVTAESVGIEAAPGHVAVYLPQAYNFAGQLLLFPRESVTYLPPGESAKWLAFIVSGGVSRGAEAARPNAR